MIANAKIKPSHLDRQAYVYVRQSTEYQVQHHLESQRRQYELADLATRHGWPRERVVVIDDDLGRSGSSASGRTGFARLVAEVALGNAGIVLGLEVSRLARNNRDWYQLLDLCSLTATLIADADGVYEPASFNDRLLLGLKGTMSEAELHVLKGRMLAGLQHKASRGELRFHLPAGYEFDEEGRIGKSPDEQIAHSIELVFAKLFEIGSVSGVLRYLLEEGLRFPRKSASDRRVRWVRPYYKALYDTITNPMYAGAYVYGRSKVVRQLDETGQARVRQKKLPMREWEVVIQDHHAAYIPWDDFLRLRGMLERNQPPAAEQASQVAREGAALLQGLARCGKCGRAMRVRYNGKRTKCQPYYVCRGAVVYGAPLCQSVGGRRIDALVKDHVLDELAPARLDVHLAAIRQLHVRRDHTLEQLTLDLESARYESERAERQFQAVEPENRLVARSLEAQWNQALARVQQLEQRLAERQALRSRALHQLEEQELRRLVQDLPGIWSAASTTDKDRKQLLRSVLDEVQILKLGSDVSLKILWKGGAVVDRQLQLPKLPRSSPSSELASLIRSLATRHTDEQIARILIRKRLKTPTGLPFSVHRVASLRLQHGIDCYRKANDQREGTCSVDEAAKILGVAHHTVYLWIQEGLLKADQITSGAPWAVYLSDADKRRLGAHDAPAGWLSLKSTIARFRVSKQTVLNWVKHGKVRYVYVTKGRRRGLRIDTTSITSTDQSALFA